MTQSLPNIRVSSDVEMGRLYSLSLSQIERNEYPDYHRKPAPFNLRWIHGYNHNVGVINLNDCGSTIAFYAASNCGVLYNWTTNSMRILQGHRDQRNCHSDPSGRCRSNRTAHSDPSEMYIFTASASVRHMITCIAADSKARWLVTADSGAENILIIWDTSDYFPQRTLFSPHGPTKLSKVALSADAKYLLTLAYPEQTTLHWWIWSFGEIEPHATLSVDLPRGSVLQMGFNPHNSTQFLLMTKSDIWIGISGKIFVMERGILKETDNYELKLRKPEKIMSPEHGRFVAYTFVGSTSQILVVTSRGSILVYGYTIEHKQNVDSSNFENLRFIKVLKIEKHRINDIKDIDGVIVTGNSGGEVHFYDDQLKMLYWVHGFQVDSVKSLSFNVSPRSYIILDPKCKKQCLCWERVVTEVEPETGRVRQRLMKSKLPSDATTEGKPLVVRDFIVCTQNQGVGFVDFVTEKLQTIVDNKVSAALAISAHPFKPFICIGYADGMVELINFVQHKLFVRLFLREHFKVIIPPKEDSINCSYEVTTPQYSVTCLKYSPSGLHLACGLNTGELLFLDPTTVDILTEPPFKDTDYEIKQISYSPDSLTMAFADIGKTVGVYKHDCQKFVWTFVGKHRAHYKDIGSVFFLPAKNQDGEFKLLSLGADRCMVEYDIGASSNEHLEVLSLDRVDQTAVPLAGTVWPTPSELDPEECRTDLPTILIANNEYKYKVVNYTTTVTLATVLGPRFESPVRALQRVQLLDKGGERAYLLFATKDVIGLQRLPLDGNPWKHVGMLGHPIKILGMCFREDLGILFTIGAKDTAVFQWAANYRSVDKISRMGGPDLDPYYCLIDSGRPGWLFQEIRDLFYYIQILCQGTFSPAMRRVRDYIPIDSLPDLMRALGFFPSEYEVENLLTEAKYKIYLRKPATEIDFEEFVKLYLNHRPAFGEDFKRLRDAFDNFASMSKGYFKMHRDDFIDMLSDHGEHFSRELSWYLLSILSGHSFEDRTVMVEDDFSFLPSMITFGDLVTNIIGIEEIDNLSDHSGSSLGGQSTISIESEMK